MDALEPGQVDAAEQCLALLHALLAAREARAAGGAAQVRGKPEALLPVVCIKVGFALPMPVARKECHPNRKCRAELLE